MVSLNKRAIYTIFDDQALYFDSWFRPSTKDQKPLISVILSLSKFA